MMGFILGKAYKKTQIFYSQADRKGGGGGGGGGGSANSALTVSECENVDPSFSMEYDSMILKPYFISL